MGYVGAITLASYPSPKKDLPGLSELEVERRTRALGVWTQSILSAALMAALAQSDFGASSAKTADIIVNSVANTIAALVMTTSFRPGTDLINGLTMVYLFGADCDFAHADWPVLGAQLPFK
jgi:hypothetical protein